MSRTVILRNELNRDFAISQIRQLPLDPKKPVEIIMRAYKKKRSLPQNSRYHKLVAMISDETGYSVDDVKRMCKEKFLLGILLVDGHEETTQKHLAIMALRDAGMSKEAAMFLNDLYDKISSTWLNTAQMADYQTKIETWAREEIGVSLPYQEDAA
jgi:hypothetical protein|tara:strand:+ start:69 stop:536 length:468 start_codon:yes stop_codon:yes gene_type:complete